MLRFCLFLLLAGACTSETGTRSGTSVGNPTKVGLTAARTTGVELTQGFLAADSLVLEPCDSGDAMALALPSGFAFGDWIDVPVGTWCTTTLAVSGPLSIDAVTNGQPFIIDLDLTRNIELTGEWEVVRNSSRYLIELAQPEWLVEAQAEVLEGTRYFGPDHPLAEQLSATVVDDAGLYRDADGDGDIDPSERTSVTDEDDVDDREDDETDEREAFCDEVWGRTFEECIDDGGDEDECSRRADAAYEECIDS
jgi:hypothetical protein